MIPRSYRFGIKGEECLCFKPSNIKTNMSTDKIIHGGEIKREMLERETARTLSLSQHPEHTERDCHVTDSHCFP